MGRCLLFICITSLFCGCQSQAPKADQPAVIGTAVSEESRMFVVSTAAVVPKSSVVSVLDEQDRKVMMRTSPRTVDRMDRQEPLTINDVIKLSQGGVADQSIIRYMRDTQASYNLTQPQIRRLQDAGVSQRVINYMVDTGR